MHVFHFMDRTSTPLIALLAGLAAAGAYATPPTTWTPIVNGALHVDEQSIERQRNGNIRVWQKEWLLPQVREKLQSDLGEAGVKVDFRRYEYSLVLWEYDCHKNRMGPVSGTNYSSGGYAINSYELDKPSLKTAPPDSAGHSALMAVCSDKKWRRQR